VTVLQKATISVAGV